MSDNNKRYMGDGVYASFNGFHVVLDTGGNTIYLEDTVWYALVEYVRNNAWGTGTDETDAPELEPA